MVTPAAREPVKGSWADLKNKLKAKFANLTHSDLGYPEGRKGEMLAKLRLKLGLTRAELFKVIEEL